MAKVTEIYTDGSYRRKFGVGGWGFVSITSNGNVLMGAGGFRNSTSNRMELHAVINGIIAAGKKEKIIVYTDSKYIVNSINREWAFWIRKNKNGYLEPHVTANANKDLWIILADLIVGLDVKFKWVKGHNGNIGNELADKLATAYTAYTDANYIFDLTS